MRLRHVTTLAVCAGLLSAAVSSQEPEHTSPPTIGRLVQEQARFDELIAPDAQIEVVADGFEWTEGPVWVAREGGFLLFSEIPGNAVMKWTASSGVTTFMKPAGYTGVDDYGREPGSNGLALDGEGRLTLAEHGDRRIARLEWDGGKRTLADNYQGKRFNSPNDLVFKSNGDLYFTDPPYGLPERAEDRRRELDFYGVYRRSAKTGEVTLLTKALTRPNGIAFSPDEKTLYVANSDPEHAVWMAFPVEDDGTLGEGRVFRDVTSMVDAHKGLPDGLKVDHQGNLFATGPGGVHVMTPEGALLGRIDTEQATANCAWGDDGSVLYITADAYVCRIRTKTKGNGW
ncbi:MAG: SMP-30/gluconolactonase/LRE family protein [Luteitalea sp.]|nr:SMP-30/gluconolactonase/LRE family protein [Luteitalea sp.]